MVKYGDLIRYNWVFSSCSLLSKFIATGLMFEATKMKIKILCKYLLNDLARTSQSMVVTLTRQLYSISKQISILSLFIIMKHFCVCDEHTEFLYLWKLKMKMIQLILSTFGFERISVKVARVFIKFIFNQ